MAMMSWREREDWVCVAARLLRLVGGYCGRRVDRDEVGLRSGGWKKEKIRGKRWWRELGKGKAAKVRAKGKRKEEREEEEVADWLRFWLG